MFKYGIGFGVFRLAGRQSQKQLHCLLMLLFNFLFVQYHFNCWFLHCCQIMEHFLQNNDHFNLLHFHSQLTNWSRWGFQPLYWSHPHLWRTVLPVRSSFAPGCAQILELQLGESRDFWWIEKRGDFRRLNGSVDQKFFYLSEPWRFEFY